MAKKSKPKKQQKFVVASRISAGYVKSLVFDKDGVHVQFGREEGEAARIGHRGVAEHLAKCVPGGKVKIAKVEPSPYTVIESSPCTAVLWHGPGHQSSTRCHLTGPHEIHECIYGCDDQIARWRGEKKFTGYFDEPPAEPKEKSK